ncbi:unnamed protein product [Darwinula stevensoni]|uniref:Uncharacterized protein n=1 Tax=Darwinula stevensoni TaxID=69355 RepID=A0A7R9AC61_9CRUS|nr:unnamed protein product [Darwinula stevensoni]CAG0900076.1 unnamed protein product [Darwinula stevensoni]
MGLRASPGTEIWFAAKNGYTQGICVLEISSKAECLVPYKDWGDLKIHLEILPPPDGTSPACISFSFAVPSPPLNQQAIVTMYDGEEVILLRNLTTKGSHTFLRIRYKSNFAKSDSNRKTKFIELAEGLAIWEGWESGMELEDAISLAERIDEARCSWPSAARHNQRSRVQRGKVNREECSSTKAAGQCTGQSAEDKSSNGHTL